MSSADLAIPGNMKLYTVVFLYPGPNYTALSDMSVPENLALQAAHLKAVRSQIEEGIQLLAAPMTTPGSKVSAMGVFPAPLSTDQVADLMQRDPTIVAGRFIFDVVQAFFPSLDCVTVDY